MVMSEHRKIEALLASTSRTFALSIPLLPEPLRSEIGIAYLMFRIIDTLEDATRWSAERRVEALAQAEELLSKNDPALDTRIARSWLADPPVDHGGYLELLAETPCVLRWYRRLALPARQQIGKHALDSARGMAVFAGRSDANGVLVLTSIQDLRDYCFVVAGLVGQMLTELYLLGRPELTPAAAELRRHAASFGEGLQLVNILKDVSADAQAGRIYLPPKVDLRDVFSLAEADLRAAAEYNALLRAAGTQPGLWAFNALNAELARATLRLLRARGLGAKLTRTEVNDVRTQIMHSAFGEAPSAGAGPA